MFEILPLIIATGLFSAAWSTFWNWFFEWRKSNKAATFTALNAAINLEKYAIACWRIAYNSEEHFRQTRAAFTDSVPELTGLPADSDWVNFSPELANEVLSFKNSVIISQIKADYSRYFEGNPFEAETFAKEKGRRAWLIAERLRKNKGLASADDQRDAIKELFAD